MQELERQFKADGGTFKEYKIGDLFVPMKGRNKLTKLDLSIKGNIPVFSSDSSNNGICGFTDRNPDYIVNDNNPVFVVFGDHTRTLNIAETSFCVMDNVKVLLPKYNNILALLYFFSVWKKGIPNLGYARHWSVAVNVKLYLPTINGEIAFPYIESVIRELQNECLIKLNDYLESYGLDKTELSKEEKDAVLKLRKGDIELKEFKVGELFTCRTGDVDVQRKHLNGEGHIYINSGVTNFGIIGRTNYPATVFPPNTITIDMFGNAYFRGFEYKMATHAHVFSLTFFPHPLNELLGLFICTQLKYFTKIYSFSNMCNWTKMKEMIVSLPIAADGEIDWDFMQNLISAESRLAIRGVVEWKDRLG